MNVVSCKWVYKLKEEEKENGTIGPQYKVRLVARGFSHIEGVDYSGTFLQVIKLNSIRALLAITARLDLQLHQIAIVTAFLNKDLVEDIYMEQPFAFEKDDPSMVVCKINKTLNRLKQAPRQWYAIIDDFFLQTLLCREIKLMTICTFL